MAFGFTVGGPARYAAPESGSPAAERVVQEREEQRRWRPLPRLAQVDWFDRLVENEVLPEEALRDWQRGELARLVAFAVETVPYYRDLFASLGLETGDVVDPEDLPRLPVLSRSEFVAHADALRSCADGQERQDLIPISSSGSTGTPVEVLHTPESKHLTQILQQRMLRWWRTDPMGTYAWIRTPKSFICPDGNPLPLETTLQLPAWPRMGVYFHTGPFLAFAKWNPIDLKAEWLSNFRPNYVRSASGQLEHLALGYQGRPPIDELHGFWACGEPMSPGMQRRVEEVFDAPVHIALGLDELGWVAVKCSEGQRYHVHPERAIMEIVDDDGQPVSPGVEGRLLLTLLGNSAMPLLRYDTGDLVEAVDGPCPCGRSLPAFGPTITRFALARFVPPGTMERVNPVLRVMEDLRLPLSANLRAYRVHQNLDGSFELRLVTTSPMPADFELLVRRAYESAGPEAPPLRVVYVDGLPHTANGKHFQFTSDHTSIAPDGDAGGEYSAEAGQKVPSVSPDDMTTSVPFSEFRLGGPARCPELESGGAAAERREREAQEQCRWRPRAEYAQVDWFDRLVWNEVLPKEALDQWHRDALSQLVDYAVGTVPYYRDLFASLGLRAEDIREPADLPRLPLLRRSDLAEHAGALRPRDDSAAPHEVTAVPTSGSTGRPVEVFHTAASLLVTRLLHQRQLRWFRVDPLSTFAWIRIPGDLYLPDGRPLPLDTTAAMPSWPRVGPFLETGPFIAYSKSNSTAMKVKWLVEHCPAYLQAASAQLEHLALALQGQPALAELRGLWAVGEPLTPGMRRRIEEAFGVPVHIAYGLDELGWVAAMCTEGQRYHVHPERAIVEIVDDAGQPVDPGTPGRLLVTLLGNPAMPLLRYDTGDLVEAVEGPCPCGRSLPAFGPVVQRAALQRSLPPGSMARVTPVLEAMEDLRLPLSANLREYRVHQNLDGSFELQLVTAGPMPAEFGTHIRDVYSATGPDAPPLRIVRVDHLPQTASGKFFQFTSDHTGIGPEGGLRYS